MQDFRTLQAPWVGMSPEEYEEIYGDRYDNDIDYYEPEDYDDITEELEEI